MKKIIPLLLLLLIGSCNFIKETKSVSEIAAKVGAKNNCIIKAATKVTNGYAKVTFSVAANFDDPFLAGKLLWELSEAMNAKGIRYDEFIITNQNGELLLKATKEQLELLASKKQVFERQLKTIKDGSLLELSKDFSPDVKTQIDAGTIFDTLRIDTRLENFDGFTFNTSSDFSGIALAFGNGKHRLFIVYDREKGSSMIHGFNYK